MELLVFLAFASTAYGLQYDGLRVKFGWSDALADIEYFFKIPRTISEAENDGWRRTERPPGPIPELRMYCPPGRMVCPLFDTAGFVAGLQIALPVEEYQPITKSEKKFVKWHASAAEGEPARDFLTSTQYYVSEESLKAGAGPQIENGATLQDGGVWVTGLDGRLMRIPTTEAELNSTTFKKQNCVPNMGTHYYYNMTRDLKCEELFSWFALVTEGELIGTGFQVFGKFKEHPKTRKWLEQVPQPAEGIKVAIPYAPACLGDWETKYGFSSLHIYYTERPWEINCKSGDSINPASPLSRLLLNGYRYFNQISDEFQKLFSGLQYDGLRVKFGTSGDRADIEYFYKIPRTISEAENEGWRKTVPPQGPFPNLNIYCSTGRLVCPLFHSSGFIVGLQIALPVDDYETHVSVAELEKRFVKWHAPADGEEPARQFWTTTQYYVSEESLKKGAVPKIENGATLQDGGVWVVGPDGHLMKIPIDEAGLKGTLYKKKNCIPNMGTHYYHNMTRDLNCEDMYHWFVLIENGKLIGTGYHSFGKIKKENPKTRSWFEKFPKTEQGIKLVIPDAPDCYDQFSEKYGFTSLHVYYTKTPWEIGCK